MLPKQLTNYVSKKHLLFCLLFVQTSLAQTLQIGAFSFTLPNGWEQLENDGQVILTPNSSNESTWLTVTSASVVMHTNIESEEEAFRTYIMESKPKNEVVQLDDRIEHGYTCPGRTKYFLTMAWVTTFYEQGNDTFVRSYFGTFTKDTLELVMMSISNKEALELYGRT
jgi:hypothetical protein